MLFRDIYKFIKDDLGLLAPVVASMNAGAAADANTKYTVTLENQGTRGKGLAAETVTINLVLPTGASVVSNTGDGYQGVKKLMVTCHRHQLVEVSLPPVAGGRLRHRLRRSLLRRSRSWPMSRSGRCPSIPAGTKRHYSVTLSGAARPVAGFRGSTVKWLKPELGEVLVNLEVRNPRYPGQGRCSRT